MILRPATDADIEWLVELRAVVMRRDLERVGVYDPVRVRRRFRDGYVSRNTRIVAADDGRPIGCTAVLGQVLAGLPAEEPVRLNVLQRSPAGRLYARHGFELEDEDAVDRWMVRRPVQRQAPSDGTVRA